MAFEFLKHNTELIIVYTPIYGADEILRKINNTEGYNIKNTFWVEKQFLRTLKDYDEDSICFSLGKIEGDFIEMNQDVVGTNHKFFFSSVIKFNHKMFIANRNVSVLKKIDQVVDGDIYIGGVKGDNYNILYEKYKDLIEAFPNSSELTKYVHRRIATLVKEFVPQCDKYEYIYENYIEKKEQTYLQNATNDTQSANQKIKLEQFKIAVQDLRELLNEAEHIGETTWQKKIQIILQLLYPQYILCTREVSFKGVDGYDKRPDYILVDANGFVDIMEIKKPTVRVLSKQASYRNNYVPSREFAGTIQQIEKYIYCLNSLNGERDNFFTRISKLLPGEMMPQVVNPKGLLILGRSVDFNEQQIRDFELIRRQYKNIAEIMTYDDLIGRFNRIILSLSVENT